MNDGLALLKICQGSIIKKRRYLLPYDNLIWEVDEFEGDNTGLIIAEVELESEDQIFALPSWIKEEVSDDNRYYNANLVQHPFKDWS
ncbi:MAG: Adenylate cyclase (EC [uncultured Aureispira sp.]|uniref:Adenylate cyclase (EC) n=1 Tax=uncultured Aureispira sp. TaxID=1331704 RepID=A0A6S6TWS1_9BACT|nr:MAG: Adenylate cyclase (EC [uncultured Aureispira sp.]